MFLAPEDLVRTDATRRTRKSGKAAHMTGPARWFESTTGYMPKYDNAGRPTCGDPETMFKAIMLTSIVMVKMLFGKLPKTW